MQSSDVKLQKLFDLNMQLHAIDHNISYLTGLQEQLCKDPCAVTIRFEMQNQEQSEINTAATQRAKTEYEGSSLSIIDALNGFQRGVQINLPSDKNQLYFTATEPTAMRVINVLLAEKREQRGRIMSCIENLLVHTMKIEITPATEDPIRSLHMPPLQ
jgi:hypothetical protein